jgi:hypothetical protein
MYSLRMSLQTVQAAHLRVVCDGCGSATAEVCGKRDPPVMARVAAVRKFKAVGWHNDPPARASARAEKDADASGYGRWYCPACARKSHL